MNIFNKVIEIIEERIIDLQEKIDEHKDKNNVFFGMDLGAHDELIHLREVLIEQIGVLLVEAENMGKISK